MPSSKPFFKPTGWQLLIAALPILYLAVAVQLVDVEPICKGTLCTSKQPISVWQYLLTSPKFYPVNYPVTHYLYHLNFRLLLELLVPIILFYLLTCTIVALYGTLRTKKPQKK